METQTDLVKSRIDHETKTKAQAVLSNVGLTMSDAMRLFLRQVVIQNGLPFDLKTPNAETVKALEAADGGDLITSSLVELRRVWRDAEEN